MVGSMMLLKILHCKRERIRKKNFANSLAQGTSQDHGDNFTKVSIKRESLSYETCRICLKEGKLPIFGGATEETSKSIKEITGVEVNADDPHPKCLCQPCHALLRGAILLRRTAQQSDRILKQPIKLPKPRSDTDEFIEANDSIVTEEDIKTKHRMLKELIKPEPRSDIDESIETNDNMVNEEDIKTKNLMQKEPMRPPETRSDTDESIDANEGMDIVDDLKTTKDNKSENKMKYGLKWICHKCEREFATFKDFRDHKMSCNHETKNITCAICKKSCTRNNYKRHMSSQHGGAPHMCDICGKKFAQSHFAKHRLIHFNDLPYKCTLCPYRGRFSESLKMHMRSHTGEKPYQCEQCPARFINKSNLIRHNRTHTGERKFHCEVCNKSYYTNRDLELHIKVDHIGSRDHVCRFCGKEFGYRNKMMKHELKVHKREKAKQKGRTPLYMKVDTMKQQKFDPSLGCSSEKIVNKLQ